MKDKKSIVIRIGVGALAAACLTVGAAIAAGEGTQTDPLITLSYLTQTAVPAILEQVDGKTATYQQELVDKLDQTIRDYSNQMEEIVQAHSGTQNAATYTVITLTKDQQLKMDIGCEAMLRIGSARCVSPSNPGLINTTTGTTLNNEGELVSNHLYMATIAGRAVKATSNTVKVLVRGGYTVE